MASIREWTILHGADLNNPFDAKASAAIAASIYLQCQEEKPNDTMIDQIEYYAGDGVKLIYFRDYYASKAGVETWFGW